jgi:hypothetical protein
MIAPHILLIVTVSSVFIIYKMLEYMRRSGDAGREDIRARLYLSAVLGMFSAWFLYWLYLVVMVPNQGKLHAFMTTMHDISMIPVGIFGFVIGAAVGLLAKRWWK